VYPVRQLDGHVGFFAATRSVPSILGKEERGQGRERWHIAQYSQVLGRADAEGEELSRLNFTAKTGQKKNKNIQPLVEIYREKPLPLNKFNAKLLECLDFSKRPRSVFGPAYGVKLEMRCTCRLVFGSGRVVSETTPKVQLA
jgi:hypothetical protein